jgi:uncharacterized protein (TIGR00255 family)
MESMTGFSKFSLKKNKISVDVQARSLNARFLETKVGLPTELLFLEEDVRKKLKNMFGRGTIDINIFFKKESLDLPLKSLKKWASDYKKNAKIIGVQDDLTMSKVLKKAMGELRDSLSGRDKALILEAVDKSLSELKKRRLAEGKELKNVLLKEVKLIKQELKGIKAFVRRNKKNLSEEWREKISNSNFETDQKRLEAEVAILLEKADITEEIDRIGLHIKEFVRILSLKSEAVGKKLDFFCQELAREANTIASKSKNAELTRLSVNLKSYVEKLRQQVQNIQ